MARLVEVALNDVVSLSGNLTRLLREAGVDYEEERLRLDLLQDLCVELQRKAPTMSVRDRSNMAGAIESVHRTLSDLRNELHLKWGIVSGLDFIDSVLYPCVNAFNPSLADTYFHPNERGHASGRMPAGQFHAGTGGHFNLSTELAPGVTFQALINKMSASGSEWNRTGASGASSERDPHQIMLDMSEHHWNSMPGLS